MSPIKTQAEKFAILDGIAGPFGLRAITTHRAEVDHTSNPIAWIWVLVDADTNPLHVSLYYNEDRQGDFIRVTGVWPHDHTGSVITGRDAEYNATNPSINVSASKTPGTADRDIRRRFLPDYAPLYAKALAVVQSRKSYAEAVERNYRLLAEAAGLELMASQRQTSGWNLRGSLPEGLSLKYVNADSVTLEISCSPERAAQMIATAKADAKVQA